MGSIVPRLGLGKARYWMTSGSFVPSDAEVLYEPGCSRDQKQPCPDDEGPEGSRDALPGRR
jgi:hypothetical protein